MMNFKAWKLIGEIAKKVGKDPADLAVEMYCPECGKPKRAYGIQGITTCHICKALLQPKDDAQYTLERIQSHTHKHYRKNDIKWIEERLNDIGGDK